METNQRSFRSVIKNPGFLNLWLNQILVQLSYNSLNFALIIWVFRLTDSNTAVSVLLFAVYLPYVIFGLFAGVLVDITDKKRVIMTINLLLALCFFILIFFKGSFLLILLVAFLVNTLAQFYIPAESSSIPLIVKKEQLLAANSLFSITLFSAFLFGFGLAGPLINHFGIDFVFLLGSLALFIAFLLSFKFPNINSKRDKEAKMLLAAIRRRDLLHIKTLSFNEMKETIELIKAKLSVAASIVILACVQVIIGILGVLIPSFFERSLQINATDASYILIIPLGLGMVVGGVLVGKFGYLWPKRKLVGRGILLSGLLFFFVGVAPLLIPVIKRFPKPTPLPFFYQPPLSAILIAGSFLLGIAMVSIVVPSTTVMQENTPEEVRGKTYSALSALQSAFTLIPILFVGILADAFGTTPIFIALGGTIALIGLLALKPDFYFDEHNLPFNFRQFLGLGHWHKKIS